MVDRRTWDEFRESKLLWWVNRTLHLFGWAICIVLENGVVIDAYPARVKFRGFDVVNESEGFIGLTKHIKENIEDLEAETHL